MSEFLLFALLGLGLGALSAGLGLGVVLSYRGSGLINVGLGGVAMLGAYVFYDLKTTGALLLPPIPFAPHTLGLGGAWATLPAFVIALLVCGVTGGLFDVVVLRRLRGASALAKLLASLGLLVTLQAIAVLRFGTSGQAAPAVIPAGPNDVVHISGQSVPQDRFILTGIVVAAAIALWAIYRYTRFGLATRAAAEDESKAMLVGLPPNELSLVNNVSAFVLAGALGVLVAPMTQLDPTTIAFAIVPALAAALFARFTSFGIVVVAGLSMGVIESLVTYFSSKSWFPTSAGVPIPGVPELLFFLIIVVAMFVRGARLPERGVLAEARLPAAPRAARVLLPAIAGAALAVVALLVFPFDFRQALINSLIGSAVCLSFVVTTGFVGQISIVQVGLAGISGFVVSKIAVHAGIGFPLGLLIGAVAATGVGVLTAVSALRVRGVSLAIVTLAAAVALEQFVFANPTIGGGESGAPVPPPHLLGLDLGPRASFPVNAATLPSPVFGFVCVFAVVLLGMLVAGIRRSTLGQRMLAVRSNERAAAAAGIDVRAIKLIAFAISSAIAGVAGALYAYNFGSVTAGRFGIVAALSFVAFAYLGGITTVSGAIVGGLLVTEGLAIHAVNVWFGVPADYQLLIAGLALILTIMFNPLGIAGAVTVALHNRMQRPLRLEQSAAPAEEAPASNPVQVVRS
jgi:branched-subunit amino acid ABC-type transport system permease component